MSTINRDDWLTALADVRQPLECDPSALTVRDFAELYHVSDSRASRMLRDLLKQGRVAQTRKTIALADGRSYPAPAYRLVLQGGSHASSDPRPRTGLRKPRRPRSARTGTRSR